MIKSKYALLVLTFLVTGCASSTGSQSLPVAQTQIISDAELQQKLAEIDTFALETSDLTPVDVAFAAEAERQTVEALSQGPVAMSPDQQQLATALLQKAEDLEPADVVLARIDELNAVPEFLLSDAEEGELEGLNYKLRARRGYTAAIGENVLLDSFDLDKPVPDALCRGLLICQQ